MCQWFLALKITFDTYLFKQLFTNPSIVVVFFGVNTTQICKAYHTIYKACFVVYRALVSVSIPWRSHEAALWLNTVTFRLCIISSLFFRSSLKWSWTLTGNSPQPLRVRWNGGSLKKQDIIDLILQPFSIYAQRILNTTRAVWYITRTFCYAT